MTNIKFTIIIPTYNRAGFLPWTIGTVLSQTYQNWECIVVDDGSTDDTRLVVEAIEDTRVRYLYQKQSERSAARNNGIDHSTGTHVCFLDSDDGYLPDHLEKLSESIMDDPGPYLWQTGYVVHNGDKRDVIEYDQPENEWKFMFRSPTPPVPYCFDREVLNEVRFPEEFWIWEDRHFTLRVLAKRHLKIVPVATAIFKDHSQRTMHSMDEEVFRAKIYQMPLAIDDVVNYLGDQFINQNSRYDIRKKKCGALLYHTQTAIRSGRRDLAKLAMKEATKFLDLRRIPRWLVLNMLLIFWPITVLINRSK